MSLPERLWASGGEKYVYSLVKMIAFVVRDAGRQDGMAQTLQQMSVEMPLQSQMFLECSLLMGATAGTARGHCHHDRGPLRGSPRISGPILISASESQRGTMHFSKDRDENRDRQTFSGKGEILTILGSEGQMASVGITKPCLCCVKAAIDNRSMNERGCFPIKLYLQRQAVGLVHHTLE